MKRLDVLLIFLLLVLCLAWIVWPECQKYYLDFPEKSTRPVRQPAALEEPSAKMEDFTLADQQGQARSFMELTRGSPSLVYFYSGCCGHCSNQLPSLSKLASKGQTQGVTAVGIQYLGNTQSCANRIKEHDLVGAVLADTKGEICNKFGVGDFTVFILDTQGFIRYRGGIDDPQAVEKMLESVAQDSMVEKAEAEESEQ